MKKVFLLCAILLTLSACDQAVPIANHDTTAYPGVATAPPAMPQTVPTDDTQQSEVDKSEYEQIISTNLRAVYGDEFIDSMDEYLQPNALSAKRGLHFYMPDFEPKPHMDFIDISAEDFLSLVGGFGNKMTFDELAQLMDSISDGGSFDLEGLLLTYDSYGINLSDVLWWFETGVETQYFPDEVKIGDTVYRLDILQLAHDQRDLVQPLHYFFFLSDGDTSQLRMILPVSYHIRYQIRNHLYILINESENAAWVVTSGMRGNGSGSFVSAETWYNLSSGMRDMVYSYQVKYQMDEDGYSEYIADITGCSSSSVKDSRVRYISDEFVLHAEFAMRSFDGDKEFECITTYKFAIVNGGVICTNKKYLIGEINDDERYVRSISRRHWIYPGYLVIEYE